MGKRDDYGEGAGVVRVKPIFVFYPTRYTTQPRSHARTDYFFAL